MCRYFEIEALYKNVAVTDCIDSERDKTSADCLIASFVVK